MIQEKQREWYWNQDELMHLIENHINERNEISIDDLTVLLPEVETNPQRLESLFHNLSSVGVSVIAPDANAIGKSEPSRGTTDLTEYEPDDLLSVYLAEMSQEPLLTHNDEVELAQQIELGKQAEEALEDTDYTAEEISRLQTQAEIGQAAREHLGRANTRLVVSIAKRYRGYGIPFPDLIQDGNVGLMRAVDRFDHRTGNRFSTYATWWIRQAVTRSLANQGRVIRIPVHMGGRMREMGQIAQRLEVERGQRPTPEEIAVAMNEKPEKIRQMMRWASRPLSLEQPVGEEGDMELGDFVESENEPLPDELTDQQLLNDTIADLLANLTAREARILKLRYGLQDGQARTLHQVAHKFGLSRERIRQIEREALAKIRLVAPDYRLQHYLNVN